VTAALGYDLDEAAIGSPWLDAAWRRAAQDWIGAGLAGAGLRPAGEPRVRLRPWSVVAKLPVAGSGGAGGPAVAWFKADPPASRFEAGLIGALHGWGEPLGLAPLAVDAGRGWSLLPDGGPALRDRPEAAGRPGPVASWLEPLRRYGRAQRRLAGRAADLLALGLPDFRPERLVRRFDELVADPAVAEALRAAGTGAGRLRDVLAGQAEVLAGSGLPVTLEHGDLHAGNVLTGGGAVRLYDWGDASLGHPCASLYVLLTTVPAGPAERRRLIGRHLAALRDPADGGAPDELNELNELDERVAAAGVRCGVLGRAYAWQRLFPGTAAAVRRAHAGHTAATLAALLAPPPAITAAPEPG
jgi:hypothetical protein